MGVPDFVFVGGYRGSRYAMPLIKRSQQVFDALCTYLKDGLPRASACAKAGIHYTTFWKWFNTDETFRNATLKAEAEYEHWALTQIKLAGTTKVDGSWQAIAWLIERRWPLKYGQSAKRIEAEVTGAVMARLTQSLPAAQLEAVANALETTVESGNDSGGIAPAETELEQ